MPIRLNDLVEFVEAGEVMLGHVKTVDGTALEVRAPDGREFARSFWRVTKLNPERRHSQVPAA